jgi:hypothetical protein
VVGTLTTTVFPVVAAAVPQLPVEVHNLVASVVDVSCTQILTVPAPCTQVAVTVSLAGLARVAGVVDTAVIASVPSAQAGPDIDPKVAAIMAILASFFMLSVCLSVMGLDVT